MIRRIFSSLVFAGLVFTIPFPGFAVAIMPVQVGTDDAQDKVSSQVFSDTNESHPFGTAIQHLKSAHVLNGYPDGSFKPDTTINRAEFLKILIGSMVGSPSGKKCFKDVGEEWFAPYVCEAKKRGIVSGYDDGTFRPDTNIAFSEAAKVTSKAYDLAPDKNAKKVSSVWYAPYVSGLEKKNAIPVSIDYPDRDVTRSEMSEMMYRLKEKVTSEPTKTLASLVSPLPVIGSCSELREKFSLQQYRTTRNVGSMMKKAMMMDMVAPMVGAPAPEAAPTAAAPASADNTVGAGDAGSDFSQTNVQVEGVDEADVVKTDGTYIYLVKGRSVRIVRSVPASDLKEVANVTVDVKNFSPSEMYVADKRLTVVGSGYNPDAGKTQTFVYIFDITDPAKPVQMRKLAFDGSYVSSRRIGGYAYFVMNEYPSIMPMLEATKDMANGGTTGGAAQDSLLVPQFFDSKSNTSMPVAPCSDIHFFPRYEQMNFLVVAGVPLAGGDGNVVRQAFMGAGDTVYASLTDLYVATQKYEYDQMQRFDIWTPPVTKTNTVMYRFALQDGSVSYKTSGSVPGKLLNQFSLDEFGGSLRVATSSGEMWGHENTATNELFVLDKNNLDQILGKVSDIGKGESIKSVRFMGKRGYVVTFRAVDPLFVIDLADAKNPRIVGELKIPGYSDYLHPYDENHLIGFGKEVDETIDADKVHTPGAIYYTAIQGFKMAIFDVSDPKSPKEMFKEVIGDRGTESELLTNHKALLFDVNKHLLAFPISVTALKDPTKKDVSGQTETVFRGAYVYTVDLDKGFSFRGKISHEVVSDGSSGGDGGTTNGGTGGTATSAVKFAPWSSDWYNSMIQRLVYIGNSLYAISMQKVTSHTLDTIAPQGSVTLEKTVDDDSGPMPLPLFPD